MAIHSYKVISVTAGSEDLHHNRVDYNGFSDSSSSKHYFQAGCSSASLMSRLLNSQRMGSRNETIAMQTIKQLATLLYLWCGCNGYSTHYGTEYNACSLVPRLLPVFFWEEPGDEAIMHVYLFANIPILFFRCILLLSFKLVAGRGGGR